MTSAFLSAAETSMMLCPSKADGKVMLMHTFMEMLLYKVFAVKFEMHRPHPKERETMHTFLYRGENFYTFRPRTHQEILVDAFPDDVDKIQFRPFTKNVYVTAGSFTEFKKNYIYHPLIDEGYFRQNNFLARMNIYTLSEKGHDLQKVYKMRLGEINDGFLSWLKANLDKALSSTMELGPSIMLIKDFNFKMLDILNLYTRNRGGTAIAPTNDFAKIESATLIKFNDLWDELDTSLDWFQSGGMVGDMPGGMSI